MVVLLPGAGLFLTSCHGKKPQNNTGQMTEKQINDHPVQNASVQYKQLQPVRAQTVAYAQGDSGEITGFYAEPENAKSHLPGLIVIHEWWGLNDNIRMMTRRLAGLGIQALAVDLYHGKTANTPEKAIKYVKEVQSRPQEALHNLKSAYHYLHSTKGAEKVGVVGWCFGGGWALQTALALPDKIDALVIYYGDLVQNKEKLSTLQMPIIGFFGEQDQNITPDKVKKFKETLKNLHKNVQIYEYKNAAHAFANPSGSNYQKKAATDAWMKTRAFLKQYLK
jgi:carboxymethylenebutenolidase